MALGQQLVRQMFLTVMLQLYLPIMGIRSLSGQRIQTLSIAFSDGETVFQFVGTTDIVAGDIIAID